ncbi:hypothetical protein VB146_02535 [Xanthomonas floridensis]|uniref:Uncharacterized protein n=1 Tax=Xanthomonas floridensis TaxID=1843580 RepID=A0ABU5PT40_9XANT|nr:hypothetical protein [Xanthomonas floridensis]MEA5122765.1 hypothetical protein [Xanthomonas floridensis]MEA5131194.1 hypothetical protein [Xanthomonas floridensis]
MATFFATPVLIVLAVFCVVPAGQAHAVTKAGASTHEVLVVNDTRLNWRHNDQVLELVTTGDGLLVTQASVALDLQLQRGDRVRTAGRTQITAVAHLLDALRAAAGKPIVMEVLRDGVQLRLTWAAASYAPLLPPIAPLPPTPR